MLVQLAQLLIEFLCMCPYVAGLFKIFSKIMHLLFFELDKDQVK